MDKHFFYNILLWVKTNSAFGKGSVNEWTLLFINFPARDTEFENSSEEVVFQDNKVLKLIGEENYHQTVKGLLVQLNASIATIFKTNEKNCKSQKARFFELYSSG